MRSELVLAWEASDRALLDAWLVDVGRDAGIVFTRRIANVGRLIGAITTATSAGTQDAFVAYRRGEFASHARARQHRFLASTKALAGKSRALATSLGTALKERPAEVAPELLTIVIVSLLVSGGADGDGGVPDLDLEFGIGAHRSIFSHSILTGVALETGLLALTKLVQLVHHRLPVPHDPLWDDIERRGTALLLAANQGASIGLAYHLLVDGLAQPAAYHDLPFAMPMPAHQALFAANGVAEGIDVLHKPAPPERRMTAPSDHARCRREQMLLSPHLRASLTSREADLLVRYGRWLNGLASGELAPHTLEQALFVEAVKGNRMPTTEFERVWEKYRALLSTDQRVCK